MNTSFNFTKVCAPQFLRVMWIVYGVTMAFPLKVNRFGFILLILAIVIYSITNRTNFIKLFVSKGITSGALLLLFFFTMFFSALFIPSESKSISSVLSFYLLFPIFSIIAFINFFSKNHIIYKSEFLNGFLLGNLISGILNIGYAIFRSTKFSDGSLVFDSSVWGNTPWSVSVNNFGNYFYSEYFSTFLHPTYASIYLELCLVYVLFLMFKGECRTLVASILIMFIIFNIYLLSARISIFCVLIIFTFFIYNFRNAINRWVITSAIAIVITITVFNPKSFESIFRRSWSEDLRLRSWITSIEVIKQYGFWGTGIRNVSNVMVAEYSKLGYHENAKMGLNCHNQFLEMFVSTGFIGLLIFSTMLGWMWVQADRHTNPLLIIFVILFCVHSFVESTLNRNQGIVLFLTFYIVLGSMNNNKVALKK